MSSVYKGTGILHAWASMVWKSCSFLCSRARLSPCRYELYMYIYMNWIIGRVTNQSQSQATEISRSLNLTLLIMNDVISPMPLETSGTSRTTRQHWNQDQDPGFWVSARSCPRSTCLEQGQWNDTEFYIS